MSCKEIRPIKEMKCNYLNNDINKYLVFQTKEEFYKMFSKHPKKPRKPPKPKK